jgi:hypothetical protein
MRRAAPGLRPDVQRMQKIRDVIGGFSQTRLRLGLPIAIT